MRLRLRFEAGRWKWPRGFAVRSCESRDSIFRRFAFGLGGNGRSFRQPQRAPVVRPTPRRGTAASRAVSPSLLVDFGGNESKPVQYEALGRPGQLARSVASHRPAAAEYEWVDRQIVLPDARRHTRRNCSSDTPPAAAPSRPHTATGPRGGAGEARFRRLLTPPTLRVRTGRENRSCPPRPNFTRTPKWPHD